MTDTITTPHQLAEEGYAPGALWILAGQAAVVAAMFFGFGAVTDVVGPRIELIIVLVPTLAMVVLAPPRRYERLVLTLPVVAYLGWWLLSYLWTFNQGAFILQSQKPLVLAAVLVAAVCYLPSTSFQRALVFGCYVIIGFTVLYTGANPGEAMMNDDGVPGWRGGFIHKNAMAPFMLVAVTTLVLFGRRSLVRHGAVGAAVALVVLAQSVTALVVGASLLLAAWIVRSLRTVPVTFRWRILTALGALGLAAAALATQWLPSILVSFGKDPTLTSRTDIWAGVIDAIGRRPLTGYGVGGVWVDQASNVTKAIQRSLEFVVFHSHNGFLEVALQLGLVGLALFLVLLFSAANGGLATLDEHPHVGTFALLFVWLVVVFSLSEVMTFGVWLALLCAIPTWCARLRIDARLAARSRSVAAREENPGTGPTGR